MCYHSYVKPCVEYLNKLFNNRITLIEGNSMQTLKNIKHTNIKIFHMDGSHEEKIVKSDMKYICDAANEGSYLILDDTDQPVIYREYQKYISNGDIHNCKLKYECNRYKHCIGQYTKNILKELIVSQIEI